MIATGEMRRMEGVRILPVPLYLSLAAPVLLGLSALFLLYSPGEHLWNADYWEHAAAVRALVTDPLHPGNPFYGTAAPSRDYSPWYVAWGAVAHAFGWQPFLAMNLSAMVSISLILAGVYLFFGEYFLNPWAPSLGLISLLFVWGEPWVWSGFHNLRSLALTGSYPSTFAFALTWLAWWAGLRALRADHIGPKSLALMAGLGALLFVSHPISGPFAIFGLLCFVLFEPGPGMRPRAALCAALLAGAASTHFWPYFDPWQVLLEGRQTTSMWLGDDRFYRVPTVLLWAGPAMAGALAMARFFRDRSHSGTAFGFAATLAVYLGLRAAGIPQGQRLVPFLILYLQIALVWLLLSCFGLGGDQRWTLGRRARQGIILVCAAFVVGQTEITALEAAGGIFGHKLPDVPVYALQDVRGPVERAIAGVEPKTVVLASCRVALMLPALGRQVVSICRPAPPSQDDLGRMTDVQAFFSPGTSDAVRRAILDRYHVRYVAFLAGDLAPATEEDLRNIAPVNVGRDWIRVLRVQ
jgi:hypothetical protein